MPQILTITHTPAETGFSYEWYKDLVRTVGATANNLTITAGGYYKVIASKSLFGTTCFYKDSLQITVNTVPVAIINNITGKNGVCVGDVISLAATPPQTGVTYKWLNGAVVVGTNPTFDVTVSGNYSLYVETTTITPCFASTPAITLSVNPYPVVTFSAISPLCNVASAKIDLRNYISPAYLASSSLFQGRGIESDGYTFNPTLAGYGTHPLSYTYTNNTSSTSCAKTANQTAVVDITPKVRLGQDVTIFAGDAILLKTTGSQGPTFTYQWTPTTNLTLTPPESPIANPSNTETYKVVVTSTVSGCTDQDEITITVRPKLVFGNTFTPNADTINETWEIQGINGYPAAEVKIYNRWGNEIFSSIGYAQPFDGIQNKERLPGGTYYYVIKPSPDVPTLTGYLTIVR
jgi:gliding motility-associated-like protein